MGVPIGYGNNFSSNSGCIFTLFALLGLAVASVFTLIAIISTIFDYTSRLKHFKTFLRSASWFMPAIAIFVIFSNYCTVVDINVELSRIQRVETVTQNAFQYFPSYVSTGSYEDFPTSLEANRKVRNLRIEFAILALSFLAALVITIFRIRASRRNGDEKLNIGWVPAIILAIGGTASVITLFY